MIQVVIYLLLTAGFAFSALRRGPATRIRRAVLIALTLAVASWGVVLGRWDEVSIWLRPVLAIFAVSFLVEVLRRWPTWSSEHSRRRIAFGVLSMLVPVALFVSVGRGLAGFSAPEASVELASPLRDGLFYVVQGGSSVVINYHNVNRSQRYALDIDEVGVLGNHAQSIEPADVRRYAVYGRPVFSPCAGRIRATRDHLPDQVPPSRDEKHAAGNYIAIDCEGITVVLAHLSPESIQVHQGDTVSLAMQIASVGNSGNSSEPHLHMHAACDAGLTGLEGEGVPIRVMGRFLVRNSLLRHPHL